MPYGTESTCYLTTTKAKILAEHENTPSRTTRTSHPGQQGRVTRDNKIGFSERTKVMSIKKSCPPLHKQEIRPPLLPSGNQRICLIGDAYTMLRPGKFHYVASTRRAGLKVVPHVRYTITSLAPSTVIPFSTCINEPPSNTTDRAAQYSIPFDILPMNVALLP